MKSKTNRLFDRVMQPKPKSASFDLSHDRKLSLKMGFLVPTLAQEVLPGDSFAISAENLLRLAPLVSPVMHKINVETKYFFVPNRIIWAQWQDWITGETTVEHPFFTDYYVGEGYEDGCLGDYLGIAQSSPDNPDQKINALPVAAYYKVYDEWFRDQNLIDEKFVPLVPGNNFNYGELAKSAPLKRAWQHDYFTSALPFAQKGDDVTLPLIQEGGVKVQQVPHEIPFALPQFTLADGTQVAGSQPIWGQPDAIIQANTGQLPLSYDPKGTLEVDLNAEASTISTLRRAFSLQRWLEKNARGGTRMIEMLKSHFGVKSSDARLQRPEYIGGSRQHMKISEVLATAETVDTEGLQTPVGQMSGHGISVGGGQRSTYRAEEHGWIIGVINVQPESAYSQGLERKFQRFDRLDYAWPDFANIGEQEILNKEVRNDIGTPESLNEVFGYIPRYSEYKFAQSTVHGDFRNTHNFWHMARQFDDPLTPPTLSEEFIECTPDNRIFAVTDPTLDNIYAHIFNNVHVVRKLPKYGIPSI